MSMAMAAKEPKAEVHVVGTISGLTIYDVFYRFQSEGAIDWKSILVRAGPNRYREIYHDEPIEGKANPSFFVKLGAETFLRVLDNQYRKGGSRNFGVSELTVRRCWTSRQFGRQYVRSFRLISS
jgi:hypothetical protein